MERIWSGTIPEMPDFGLRQRPLDLQAIFHKFFWWKYKARSTSLASSGAWREKWADPRHPRALSVPEETGEAPYTPAESIGWGRLSLRSTLAFENLNKPVENLKSACSRKESPFTGDPKTFPRSRQVRQAPIFVRVSSFHLARVCSEANLKITPTFSKNCPITDDKPSCYW